MHLPLAQREVIRVNPTLEKLKKQLSDKDIHLSHQRMKILQYLADHPSHPTADQIFTDLKKSIPTLSKTTIYNTLRLFLEAGLIRVLNIDDYETRYDTVLEDHGHFLCSQCGSIYNFSIDLTHSDIKGLEGFDISARDVYFSGRCPHCLARLQDENNVKE